MPVGEKVDVEEGPGSIEPRSPRSSVHVAFAAVPLTFAVYITDDDVLPMMTLIVCRPVGSTSRLTPVCCPESPRLNPPSPRVVDPSPPLVVPSGMSPPPPSGEVVLDAVRAAPGHRSDQGEDQRQREKRSGTVAGDELEGMRSHHAENPTLPWPVSPARLAQKRAHIHRAHAAARCRHRAHAAYRFILRALLLPLQADPCPRRRAPICSGIGCSPRSPSGAQVRSDVTARFGLVFAPTREEARAWIGSSARGISAARGGPSAPGGRSPRRDGRARASARRRRARAGRAGRGRAHAARRRAPCAAASSPRARPSSRRSSRRVAPTRPSTTSRTRSRAPSTPTGRSPTARRLACASSGESTRRRDSGCWPAWTSS